MRPTCPTTRPNVWAVPKSGRVRFAATPLGHDQIRAVVGNLRRALEDVRREEDLPERPLMVVNSHAHLDHVGGNAGFLAGFMMQKGRIIVCGDVGDAVGQLLQAAAQHLVVVAAQCVPGDIGMPAIVEQRVR